MAKTEINLSSIRTYDEALERVQFPEPLNYDQIGRLVVGAILAAHAGELDKPGSVVALEGPLTYTMKVEVAMPMIAMSTSAPAGSATTSDDPLPPTDNPLCFCVEIPGLPKCCTSALCF